MEQVDRVIADEGIQPFRLPSGAGHDGMAMIALAEIGARVLLRFMRNFKDRRAQ